MEQSSNTTSCCSDTSNDKTNKDIIKHRDLFSHMVLSHIPIIIPCIWWVFGYNSGTYASHCVDKLMAIILTSSILISSVYHYYYECVLHSIETNALILNTVLLNFYMYYRGVHIMYIASGFGILYGLHLAIHTVESNGVIIYEKYHPFCHYIAGIYVMFCVYLIQQTFGEETIGNVTDRQAECSQ